MVTNEGAYNADEATIMSSVDAALARWQTEAAGALTFDRVATSEFESALACSTTNAGALRSEGEAQFPGVSFGGASHNDLIVIEPSCFGSSQAIVGHSIVDSSGKVSLAFSTTKGTQSLLHELGHTFGLQHAYADQCDSTGVCSAVEYANDYDIMGTTMTGTPAFVPAAFDTYDLDRLGLGDRTGMQTLALAPGTASSTTTVALSGRGTDAGVRGLKVVDPVSGDTYYLDFRNGLGRDAGAWYRSSSATSSNYYNKGVTIEKATTNGTKSYSVLQTFPQLDGSGYRYAKTAGETFQAGNVSIDVTGMQLTGAAQDTATVQVTLTNPTALEPDHTVTTSASTVSVKAGRSSSVSVTVNSVNGFADATDLSASGLPAGVTASFAPTAVTPVPDGSADSVLSLTASPTAAAGSWPITVSATAGTRVRSTTFTLTVPAPVTLTALTQTVAGATGSQTYFSVDVPVGATNLKIKITGGTGDADLYTRFGAAPTKSTYTCRPYLNGNEESCSVPAPSPGTWQVMLVGWKAYANVTLTASYTY